MQTMERLLVKKGWKLTKPDGYNAGGLIYTHKSLPLAVELHVHNMFNAKKAEWIHPCFRFTNGSKPSYVVGLSYTDLPYSVHTVDHLEKLLSRLAVAFTGVAPRSYAAHARKVFGIR